mmetsp:Transcript_66982/g.160468  ORF Transcript_66982/g.160468 Transcript_66982/m.160468 type:complete len:141 (+) Transcript_66982:84-506(+)
MAAAGIPQMKTVDIALKELRQRVKGLNSITVTDRDGAMILQEPKSDEGIVSQRAAIMSTVFSMTTDHTEKIGCFGKVKTIMSTNTNNISLQANQGPLVIRLTAAKDANVAAMMELLPQIQKVLKTAEDVISNETEQNEED